MNSKIDSLLWVGAKPSKLGALILTRLMRFEIYSLLKPSGEESHPRKSGLGHYIPEYLSIETATLSIVTSEIVDIRRKGKKVYLHCREGVGRAPTVAAAVLVAEGAEHALALSTIRKLRPTYNPTAAQSESLRRFFDAQSNSK